MHSKHKLPEKICPICKKSFKWRKKWRNEWEEVKYCSQRCRFDARKTKN